MSMGFAPKIITDIIATGTVTADDVLKLRREVWADGMVAANEVEWMFRIEEACQAADDAWPTLFVEAVTDAIVHEAEPQGYVNEAEARWLIERISRDGVIGTQTELELLIKIMESARSVPDALATFAIAQVANAVVYGTGPLAKGGELDDNRINRDEVELLRRILYARAGDGGTAVSRAEADVLFELNHETSEADNDPAWSDLFVRCMANHILAASGYTPPSREEALRRSAWLDERSENMWSALGSFGRSVLKGGLKAAKADYSYRSAMDARNDELAAEMAETEKVTAEEADWLIEQFSRDRKLCDNERALIEFLHEESVLMDPRLTRLLEAA